MENNRTIKDDHIVMVMKIRIPKPENLAEANDYLYKLSKHVDRITEDVFGGVSNTNGRSVSVQDDYGNNVALPFLENA